MFSQYPEKTLKLVFDELQDYEPEIFDGSLPDAKRKRIMETFQETAKIKVLLISVKAGGTGITLTSANHVFHFDHWWNPATAAQAEGRARRDGQKKRVVVTSLLTRNTIEKRIHDKLEEKRSLFNAVFGDMTDLSLEKVLTEDELFGLFDLQKKRV
ncbi:MAG: C-terminal helicase domain-containing protein [Chloroflexota bacterium]